MIDGAFVRSTLEMPDQMPETAVRALSWTGTPLNWILVTVSVALMLMILTETIRVFPAMAGCLWRWRFCISFEHSLSLANPRNTFAAVMIIPFCLLADRFALYDPSFLHGISPNVSSAVIIGIFLVYLIIRFICFRIANLRRMHGDELAAVHKTLYTCFAICTLLLIATSSIALSTKTAGSTLRTVLYVEMGVFFLNAILKEGQILGSRYGVLSTILYLCALEILPAALLTASAVLL